jgi:hypothetical protein
LKRAAVARRAGRARRSRPPLLALVFLFGAGGCAGSTGIASLDDMLESSGLSGASTLDEGTIVSGLKEALRVGTENAVALTSAKGGFLDNDLIRIPLPDSLDPMADALRSVGFGSQVDELEVSMNRAAEQAAGEAGEVFWNAIRSMSIADARGILDGGDTAATDYFRRVTSQPLFQRFEPIVAQKMDEVGLVRLYDGLADRYRAIPLIGSAKPPPEIEGYVTDKTLDGLFTVLAEQEQKIRTDPSARVTELLQRVFGGQPLGGYRGKNLLSARLLNGRDRLRLGPLPVLYQE